MIPDYQEQFNLNPIDREILGYVRQKPRTVAEIAQCVGRSMPSVSSVLNRLMDDGWVALDGVAESTGGRRPRLFRLIPDVKWTLGIDVGRRSTRVLCMDLEGTLLYSNSYRSPNLNDHDAVLNQLDAWVEDALEASGLNRERCLGVGFALPGLVDSQRGMTSTYLVTEQPLREVLTERFGLPVLLVNDARAMAYGEYRIGAARGIENVLLVNMGWGGTGMGIILEGRLHFGAHRHAGEFGHITVDPDGELCTCGKRGCLETVSSGQAMVRRVINGIQGGEKSRLADMVGGDVEEIDTGVLVDAIRQGDQLAINTLLETANVVGKGLAVLMTLFDPEVIVIGGYVSASGDLLIDALRASARASIIPQLGGDVNIVASELGDLAASIGAASMLLDPLFLKTTCLEEVQA